MGLLNYTTTVDAMKSIGEITTMLSRNGARRITQEYDEAGKIVGVAFTIAVYGLPVYFVLPARVEPTFKVLLKQKPYNSSYQRSSRQEYERKTAEQAERVAWRIVKDWTEAQLALIETGQAEMAQVFLPYMQSQNGHTMYELWLDSHQKQLPAPSENRPEIVQADLQDADFEMVTGAEGGT